MTDTKKPREIFLSRSDTGTAILDLQFENESLLSSICQGVKYIEYSSYEKVIEDNKKLIEALKYYAGADQWGHISKDDATYSVMDSDDLGIGEFQFNEITDDKRVAGLKARQVLKELGIE